MSAGLHLCGSERADSLTLVGGVLILKSSKSLFLPHFLAVHLVGLEIVP